MNKEELVINHINAHLDSLGINPQKNIEDCQELAKKISEGLQNDFNNGSVYENDNYSYIVLVEAHSTNDYAFSASGNDRLSKTDHYFVSKKEAGDFYFLIHVWQIDITLG